MGGAWGSKKPVPVAICCNPGCSNPTWNGQPGEYCSKKCRQGGPLCATPGCGKPTWNGHPGEYCSQSCRRPTCAAAGCGKPTWNGQPGGYCSQSCRSAASSPPLCAAPGCGKPTWNGQPGGYCSMGCKTGISGHSSSVTGFECLRPGCGKLSWKDQPGAYCSAVCRNTAPAICMQMGCGKPTWNGQLDDYCSKACRDTRVCVRPGCGKPTWNGNPNEFCTHRCRQLGPPHLPATSSGLIAASGPLSTLVEVADPDVLAEFQTVFDVTHKRPPNNWTRDRGCTVHGVGDASCSLSCAFSNQVPVPGSYEVVKVEMNLNPTLWSDYVKARDAIAKECQTLSPFAPNFVDVQLQTFPFAELGKAVGAQPLRGGCNEWRLFHGTSRQACEGICETNFAVSLAGSGATWKAPGQGTGQPLYGYGIYLAEHITKADEYAKPEGPNDDFCCVLVCRVVGGRANVIQTNNIDVQSLQQDITSGTWDSVVGDRVAKLDKPFREVVIYSNDQVLPEFLVTYRRQ